MRAIDGLPGKLRNRLGDGRRPVPHLPHAGSAQPELRELPCDLFRSAGATGGRLAPPAWAGGPEPLSGPVCAAHLP